MINFLKSLFLLLFLTTFSFSEDIIFPNQKILTAKDENFKDLVWNRYTTENFIILSIDDSQGRWLNANIERIKSSCLKKWGIEDFKFQKECRIMVVPNQELLKKLFNITEPRCEIRKVKDDLEVLAAWTSIESNEDLIDKIPFIISVCSLTEYSIHNNLKNNFVLINGMSLLNQSFKKIKTIKDQDLNVDIKISNLFLIDDNKFKKMNSKEKNDFNKDSLILCLMLKKEFGENKFLKLFISNNKEEVFESLYKFTIKDFNKTYARYTRDLFKELKEDKVPDRYIDVKKK